ANQARIGAAIASRDIDALPTLFAGDAQVVYHPTGSVFDRSGLLAACRALFRSPGLTYQEQEIATLGDALALLRNSVNASASDDVTFDGGAYEIERIHLHEIDAQGECRRSEVFAADRLGEAIVRLYERYAELLPAGPERERAAGTARSVAKLLGPIASGVEAPALAPSVEWVDHRTLIGLGSSQGAEAVLHEVVGSLLDLSEDVATHVDDIVALRPDALLVRLTTSGILRSSG